MPKTRAAIIAKKLQEQPVDHLKRKLVSLDDLEEESDEKSSRVSEESRDEKTN